MTQFASRHGIKFVLASITVNALIGIVAIVSGDFSDLDGKILVTSLSVTGGSVLALSNLTARRRGGIRYVPESGAVASVIGFALLIAGVWGEFTEDGLWKSAVTGIFIGLATAHGALLSLSRLNREYRPVLWAAWALAVVLVIQLLIVIWNSEAADSGVFWQATGVVGVALAATTIAVPILHWAGKRDTPVTQGLDAGDWSARHCPNCGASQITTDEAGHRCASCGARFEVNFRTDR